MPTAPMEPRIHQPAVAKDYTPERKRERPVSPNAVRDRVQKSLDESEKRLKAIEDHMWQHRQQERNLRRAENDLVRQQKHMESGLKQFENKIAKRQAEETSALLDKEAKFSSFWQKDLHQRKELTKEKIQNSHTARQKLNETENKYTKTSNEMCWRYRNLMERIERKRTEMEELSKQFEARVREKEEEQLQMKQELATLAISLNMETHKKRRHDTDTLKQVAQSAMKEISQSQTRQNTIESEEKNRQKAGTHFVEQQRDLAQSLQERKEIVKSKQRQEGRNLADVRTNLKHTIEDQYYMKQEMDHIRFSLMNESMKERVAAANSKRDKRLTALQKQIKDRNEHKMKDWVVRAVERENESKLKEHSDRLKQLSKLISHHDSVEHSLFSQAREADALIKKQNQTVSQLQTELDTLKKTNARKLKEVALAAERAEHDLHQKLLRETAELSRAFNAREENIRSFHTHKNRNREDRKLLNDEKKEHDRRVRIADRTRLKASTTKTQ